MEVNSPHLHIHKDILRRKGRLWYIDDVVGVGSIRYNYEYFVRFKCEAGKPRPIEIAIGSLHQISDYVYWYTAIDRCLGETAEVVSGADSGSSVLVGPTSWSSWGKRVGDDAALK